MDELTTPDAIKRDDRPRSLAQSPAVVVIIVLIPLMLIETIGILAEGRRRYGTLAGAILLMGGSLALVWNIFLGTLMYLGRGPVRRQIQKLPMDERGKFVIFATVLVLLEEAVTTGLTNLAPRFGHSAAFITASRNYLEVICWHSVVVIMPMFAVWSLLLFHYRFSAAAVFVLFGINGVLAEFLIGGPALLMAPFWIFVYGLMVFLPAFSFQHRQPAARPRWYHYPLAVMACLFASAMVAALINIASPHLPHFGSTLSLPP